MHSRNRPHVPFASGLLALIMPSDLPMFLMPNGGIKVTQKSVGSTKERITISVGKHSSVTLERLWGMETRKS